ncbi:MAG: hypothetical protein A3H70_00935 [Candidatus Komeilibacteria bacterium RIFCSPLOWO2_02_FULL_48_11]|uniref:Antitoxin n=1 Tax=Candidatus Komeilibacteria bacterium RIFCSPLOWO2_02_FULL_48_11 TaxID=1798553 RepID=A0A1G2BSX6_9BACT|nr:MAG: hypothetical protein A3H70_00935 [Candidatus Komeilibacteria bacterium RIFCSPLOWO2_02_FULL_48_11]
MNTKTTLSISEARKNIFDIAEAVQKPGLHYTFTENGKPKAVLISADEFDSLLETMEILNDPKALANIKKAEQEFARGEHVSWDEAKRILGWDKMPASLIRDRGAKHYGTPSKKLKKK